MKIAFIHYHLKAGGVTTVLRQQIDALAGRHRTLILSGSPPDGPLPTASAWIPELNYDIFLEAPLDPEKVAVTIEAAIKRHFGGNCDILHVHNPTLAKNKFFLQILKALQKGQTGLLLQIHDFAEDGRPAAYFHEDYLSDVHYCVINSRDYNILMDVGLIPEGVHKLPNAVDRPTINITEPLPCRHSYVLYPIRAIRRKNIGEAILLSLYLKEAGHVAITLPPNSPSDLRSYNAWQKFVSQHKLPVDFDVGLKADLPHLLHSAQFAITTSITEGFGFSYLEPWLSNKLLWGRKLKEICNDFEKSGIRLNHCYTEIRIPVDWFDRDTYYRQWRACVQKVSRLFEHRISANQIQNAFHEITRDGVIDFGLLNERFQKQIILRVLKDRGYHNQLLELNRFLIGPENLRDWQELIHRNQAAVLANYSRSRYGRRLERMYEAVLNTPVRQRIDKNALLEKFLRLSTFSLLKWCDDGHEAQNS